MHLCLYFFIVNLTEILCRCMNITTATNGHHSFGQTKIYLSQEFTKYLMNEIESVSI